MMFFRNLNNNDYTLELFLLGLKRKKERNRKKQKKKSAGAHFLPHEFFRSKGKGTPDHYLKLKNWLTFLHGIVYLSFLI